MQTMPKGATAMTRTLLALFLMGWALWATDDNGNPTHVLRVYRDAGACLEASYRTSLFTGQTTTCKINYSL
jgi:hypothetical protein